MNEIIPKLIYLALIAVIIYMSSKLKEIKQKLIENELFIKAYLTEIQNDTKEIKKEVEAEA